RQSQRRPADDEAERDGDGSPEEHQKCARRYCAENDLRAPLLGVHQNQHELSTGGDREGSEPDPRRFSKRHAAPFYSASFGQPATMRWDVKFLRQAALLLPSAFLLNVLIFLLTHGRQDPGFGTFPFFQEWFGDAAAARPPETRFVEQALVFFLPAY